MGNTKEELTLTLHPVDVGKSFPAIWEGIFNELPDEDQIRTKESKIRKIMEDDLKDKIANDDATSGFRLHFKWTKIPYDPKRVFLKITAERPDPEAGDGNEEDVTSPTPKSPPPPPQ